ncbi:GNAT family N-acetyltransferase [Nocardioides sp. MAHUQ-72]|uniref:GNAT family N-acetyltransferase n=1 Tax=unclassified Nocardioides TaxID=2615069 RepID=UPI00360A7281
MTGTEIVEIDARDETRLRDWWEVAHAAEGDRPFDAWPTWDVTRRKLPVPRTDGRLVLTLARDGEGRVVGAGRLLFYRYDNTHLAEVTVWVPPAHRRRGIGRALLEAAEARARREGRTTLMASAYAPVGEDSPGSLFAAGTGFEVGSYEETKLVDLATAPATWDALDREVEAALGDYRLEVAVERLPEERIEDFCRLLSAFLGEVPTGDLDLRRTEWTPQRVRDGETRAIGTGRVLVYGLAVAPDGHLCGFSDVRVHRADPRHASVGGTLVLPGHRGHRLGLGMKLLTHRQVHAMFPECTHVETGNAGVNAAMNAVNERLGYRVVERCLDVQKLL